MSAIIYKITSPDGSECYVGSTIQKLAQRKTHHKSDFACIVKGTKTKRCRSYGLFERHGFAKCIFSVVEQTTPDERLVRERHWIEAIGTLGQNRPVITEDEKKELKHESYLRTKANHPEVLKERSKASSIKRKPITSAVVQCECGQTYTAGHEKRHKETDAHLIATGQKEAPVKEEKEPTPEEVEAKKQKAREVMKRCYDKDPAKFVERSKKYAEEHKEDKEAYNKTYYANNKQTRKEKFKEWYETVGKKVVVCECGESYTVANKSRHIKSLEHTNYLSSH